jgi:nucleotide-binding universal stress UspA family protein
MSAYKNILCPTDLSEPSWQALGDAVELAAHFGARLWVLHAVDLLPTMLSDMGLGFVDLPVARKTALDEARRTLAREITDRVPSGIAVASEVREGFAPEQIRIAAHEWKADLIVIATHGATGWRHLVFGSVAAKVIQTAPCDVLTVRALSPEKAASQAERSEEMAK